MRFLRTLINSLTLPNTAGPNDPRVVIGDELPPELIAYYASHSETALRGTVYYKDLTHYEYDILVFTPFGSQAIKAIGGRNGGAVAESMRYSATDIAVGANGDPTGFFIENNAFLDITLGASFLIDGIEQGRGLLWETAAAAATGAVAVETVFLTAPSATYKAGRAFRIEWVATSNSSIANIVNYKFRRTNLAGANKASWAKTHPIVNALSDSDWVIVINGTGVDITDTAVLTVQPSAGTVNVAGGAGVTVAAAQCWDVGAAAQFTLRTQF